MNARSRNRAWLCGSIAGLCLLYHDFWFWSDPTLVLGFLPVGLFYHVALSLLAGAAWWAVVRFGWPGWIEDWASGVPRDRDA